ncbi:RNA polymerase sigma factor [Hyalangium versicolor]|uniref:RNA polymerase sigma factor n=1 Tax=Hyalangium versicolor TaxID=2861190 RepID=UPI001CCFFAA5|nr:sigma-70 family RNA polymerase sigma factor [Hyalangium versicolor]
MDSSRRKKLEEQLRALCQARQYGRAAAIALEGYGAEIRKVMKVTLRNESRVDDAFSAFSENLLTSLPGFRWESSFRTWIYGVARNTCLHSFRAPDAREQPLPEEALEKQPMIERTVTQPWLRTEVKSRFKALQERLTPHEQRILSLRVESGLSWTEVARAMAGRELPPAELEKRAAVLRQQFQRIKARLRLLAIDEELLSSH